MLPLWSACFALALSARAAAREDASPVTLQQAQERAQARAPDVAVALARAETARADVAVAGRFPNPSITAGATSGSAIAYANLFIALPLFGQRGTALDAADAQARAVAAGVEIARLDARFAAGVAWIGLWQTHAELQVATDNAARRARLLETTRARFSEGAAPRLDVLRAETEARRAVAEVRALGAQQQAAAERLAAFIGGASGVPVLPGGDPKLLSPAPAPETLEVMLSEHPLARRARAMLGAADKTVTRERRARWPLAGVQVGGSFLNRAPPPANELNVALTVELPIFNAPLIVRAERAADAARVELDALDFQLRARVAAALADHAAAASRQEAQVREVLPTAREAAELSLEAYQTGGLDLTGALAAQQALSDANLAAARLTADRARALATLEHAAGRAL